jgi:glycerophosphoryl diester phosphodiesterase
MRINGIGPIPTLDEALDAFPEQFFTADLKDEAAIESLVKSLQRKGVAERVCIAGAWDGWLGHVRREVLVSRDQLAPMVSRREAPTNR